VRRAGCPGRASDRPHGYGGPGRSARARTVRAGRLPPSRSLAAVGRARPRRTRAGALRDGGRRPARAVNVTEARRRFSAERVARLATTDASGHPHLVPIVFAVSGETIYSAVDAKPKRSMALRRLANVAANPRSPSLSTTTRTPTGVLCGGYEPTAPAACSRHRTPKRATRSRC